MKTRVCLKYFVNDSSMELVRAIHFLSMRSIWKVVFIKFNVPYVKPYASNLAMKKSFTMQSEFSGGSKGNIGKKRVNR